MLRDLGRISMPKNLIVTTRTNIENVATIATYLRSKNIQILTKSKVISIAIEVFSSMIINEHPGLKYSPSEALSVLASLGIDMPERSSIALMKSLQEHSMALDAQDRSPECLEQIEDIERGRESEKLIKEQLEKMKDLVGLDISD